MGSREAIMASTAAKHMSQPVAQQFFEKHSSLLDRAEKALLERTYWSAYPEIPSGKIYGESAKVDAENAFKALLNKPFDLDQPSSQKLGQEESPYGFALGITYPSSPLEKLLSSSTTAGKSWSQASIDERAGIALEILSRLNKQSFLIANAVMHTSGPPA